jgi:hypothetical protein
LIITIRAKEVGGDRELASLCDWLKNEPDIRRHAHLSLVPGKPGPADMGFALEVVQLVVDSGFQALSLALAYATWRSTRPNRSTVTFERDGTKVTLEGTEENVVEIIVRALE